MSIEEKLKKARLNIILKYPRLGYILLRLKMNEDKTKKNTETIAVNTNFELYYNPEFLENLNEREIFGVILHEVLHLVRLPLDFMEGVHPVIFNIASDIKINELLLRNYISLPNEGIIPDINSNFVILYTNIKEPIKIEDIDKKTTIDIYKELVEKLKDKTLMYKPDLKIIFKRGESSEGEVKKIKDIVMTSFQGLRGDGQGLEEMLISEIQHINRINWINLLKMILRDKLENPDFKYPSLNKKSEMLPKLDLFSDGVGEIVITLDTSGSMWDKEILSKCLGVIDELLKETQCKGYLILWDDGFQSEIEVNPNIDLSKIRLKGGGGTNHSEIYKYIMTKHKSVKAVVNITDGETIYPEDPKVFTIWVLTSRDGKIPPFGKVIYT